VQHIIGCFGLSQRRASLIIGINRNTLRYDPVTDKDEELRSRMKEIAEQRRRFGCRRLHILLKREGLVRNHKRTERLYKEEKLALRIRRRKKLAAHGRIEIERPTRPNQLWAVDFLHDSLHNGRKVRFLPIIDTYTKECLRIEVDTSIGGKRVCAVLSHIASIRELPEKIVVDNGPEFISNTMDAWAYERGVKLHFIRPGKPVDNAFMESFNGKFRDECLNLNWFMSVGHAREIAEAYRHDYNNERPHSSLGDLTPAEFIKRLEEANTVGVL
jgi:putative transposase